MQVWRAAASCCSGGQAASQRSPAPSSTCCPCSSPHGLPINAQTDCQPSSSPPSCLCLCEKPLQQPRPVIRCRTFSRKTSSDIKVQQFDHACAKFAATTSCVQHQITAKTFQLPMLAIRMSNQQSQHYTIPFLQRLLCFSVEWQVTLVAGCGTML